MKIALCCLLMLETIALHASKRDKQSENLAKYLARVQQAQPAAAQFSFGSIWTDSGTMASLSADYKAKNVGDTIEIVVVQGLTSSNANAVSTARTLATSGGLDSTSTRRMAFSGKGQASTATTVSTNLAGQVVAVLASGNLVVEAERIINMNNEKQTIILRGVVRRGDIGPNNQVASDAIGDLELEIKGKGVLSDGVRQPRRVLRTILHILDF